MYRIIQGIVDNWKWFAILGTAIVVLSLTGTITVSLRSAKQGLKQVFTPLGFFVLAFIVIVIIILFNKLGLGDYL
jgi:hypothetical protein